MILMVFVSGRADEIHLSVMALAIWGVAILSMLHEFGVGIQFRIVEQLTRLLFRNRIVMTVGAWSYSTYLAHIPIITVVGVCLLDLEIMDDAEALYLAVVVSIPFILIFSYLLYRFMEVPGINVGRKISARL